MRSLLRPGRRLRPCCRTCRRPVEGLFHILGGKHSEYGGHARVHAHRPGAALRLTGHHVVVVVSPRMIAPRQITASQRPLLAKARATTGNSKEPGTQATVMSESRTPQRVSVSSAPSSNCLVMISLKPGNGNAYPQTLPVHVASKLVGHNCTPLLVSMTTGAESHAVPVRTPAAAERQPATTFSMNSSSPTMPDTVENSLMMVNGT